ncbi:hypothetical protein ES708_07651 [subsurface metagenome]
MAVILFIDMLGARKRWRNGGVAESMPTFYRFKKMVNIAARQAPAEEVLDGIIETDAAMLVCRSTVEAAGIARRLFLVAFANRMNSTACRDWYRGCIVPHTDGEFLRADDALREPVQEVRAFRYSESALEAVSVEKSGFKGMRLLVKSALIDANVHAQMKIPFGTHTLIPFRKLNYSHYPARVAGEYTDFLWMACQSESDWYDLTLHMTSRLRYAGRDQEELAQAAATQIVFHECAAIRQSVISRAQRAKEQNGDA